MDWKEFFTLSVWKEDKHGARPYFQSMLKVPDISIEKVSLCHFLDLGLTLPELTRLSLGHRKVLHSLHYFNSIEFDRICENFSSRLRSERKFHCPLYVCLRPPPSD